MGQARESKRKAGGFMIRSQHFEAPTLTPGLYVVATPIGNLGDITIRALDTLAAADLIACEDTRVTRKLLTRYGIAAEVVAYHEHSGPKTHRRLLDALAAGKSVALVSDAGTPLISDPGLKLVADAAEQGSSVIPVPGPSSVVTALSAAGLPSDAVLFVGFLPSKQAARRKRLAELNRVPATLVVFESPGRSAALLADASAILGEGRKAVLCRELTKIHETFERGTLAELNGRLADQSIRGEVVVLIAPPDAEAAPDATEVEAMLRQALASAGVKDAAEEVALATGLSRRDLYKQALALRQRTPGGRR
jgi:16S rRNA (cytidine1402-2'-O)-methyltransferase